MRVTLGGQLWHRRLVKQLDTASLRVYGDCNWDDREIRIVRGQAPREELDTDLHEALHACFPWINERTVSETASELTALLYDKLGYRRK